MQIFKEFREFALKGNVVDLAVGVVTGAAFGKIVSSLVADIIMPPIGLLIGGINFAALKFVLKPATIDSHGKVVEAVTLNYGNFLQSSFDFLIIAFSIFMVVKAMNAFRNRITTHPTEGPPPSAQELLLTEIRDILKTKS